MLTQLSKKEIKKIIKQLKDQFGIKELKIDYSFFKNNDNKIFIVSNKFNNIDQSKFRINNVGLYILKLDKIGIRLSIEGSQLIGSKATKNVLETDQYKEWMKGNDISTKDNFKGFVIIKYKKEYFGSGFYKDNKILNFIPKSRRLKN